MPVELTGRIREGTPTGDPSQWEVASEEPAGDPWRIKGQQRMGEYLKAQGADATPNPEDVQADETTVPGGQPPSAPAPQWQPVKEEPFDSSAFEAAAARVRRGVKPENGRQEGPLTQQPGLTDFSRPDTSGEHVKFDVNPWVKISEEDIGRGTDIALAGSTSPIKSATAAVTKQVASKLADDLQALRQSSVADRAEVGNTIRALPEAAVGKNIGEKLYHAAEDPAELAKLTPEERALYDQHLAPLRTEQAALATEAKNLGGGELVNDPNYMHRIAKGHAPAYDSLSGDSFDPVTGTRGLPRTTSALQERKFYSIEKIPDSPLRVARRMPDGTIRVGKLGQIHADLIDADHFKKNIAPPAHEDLGFVGQNGKFMTREEATNFLDRRFPNLSAKIDGIRTPHRAINAEQFNAALDKPVRKVVSPSPDGVTVWNNRKPTNIATDGELVPGETIDLNGQKWKVGQATTKEIEQHGAFAAEKGGLRPAEYHKNAFVNTADAVVRLREVVRNLKFIEEVKKSPWWLDHAQVANANRMAPKGWREPLMPQFKGWKVDPKIADVLDDFYKPGILEPENALRKINQFATSSMFWNPIPHMQNVGVHWAVGRGWDWIRPGPLRHFAADMTRAIKATVTQNADYQRFLRQGGGLVYGGVKNADFYGDMARHMGMEIEKNWSQYQALFKKLGISRPAEAVAWWYQKMRETLWASSDMFMMHRYLELERKGMSSVRAMKEAEKHIPNYRIPAEILGSRTASRFAQEPAAVVFARYHYGMWKSFMHMAADLAKGTPAEKKEALGNVAALAFMGYVAYPIVDAIYQKITGDPNARLLRRGAMSVPHAIAEMTRDRQGFSQFLQSSITAAPATKEILQQFFGKDFFTGMELGDTASRAEHAAGAVVSPYATARQLTSDAAGARGPARTALDTVVGGENTSERVEKGKRYGAVVRERARKHRRNQPAGPIEKGYNAVESGLGLAPAPKGAGELKLPKAKKEPGAKRSHHNKEKGY